jgi:hypothetical protein
MRYCIRRCRCWDTDLRLAPHLQPVLNLLQHVYPHGVPEQDYPALLVVLQGQLSARNLAAVVAELTDGETVVVENDAAAAMGPRRPRPDDVKRVREVLMTHGWAMDDS